MSEFVTKPLEEKVNPQHKNIMDPEDKKEVKHEVVKKEEKKDAPKHEKKKRGGKAAAREADLKALTKDKSPEELRAEMSIDLKQIEPLKQALIEKDVEVNDLYPSALEEFDETKEVKKEKKKKEKDDDDK